MFATCALEREIWLVHGAFFLDIDYFLGKKLFLKMLISFLSQGMLSLELVGPSESWVLGHGLAFF